MASILSTGGISNTIKPEANLQPLAWASFTATGNVNMGNHDITNIKDLDINNNVVIDGTLGVGTATPSAKIHSHIASASFSGLKASNSVATSGLNVGVSSAGEGTINIIDSQPLILSTANTERARILSGGNIAIGKTTASATVDIQGTLTASGKITSALFDNVGQVRLIEDSGGNLPYITFLNSSLENAKRWEMNITHSGTPHFDTSFNTSSRLRLTQSGLTGFNNNNPAVNLHVSRGDGNTCALRLNNTTNSNGVEVSCNTTGFMDLSNNFTTSASAIRFFTNNGSERMRILQGGNVGINNTNPNYLLDINGIARAQTQILIGSPSSIPTGTTLATQNTTTQNGFFVQNNGANGSFVIRESGGASYIGTNNSANTAGFGIITNNAFALTANNSQIITLSSTQESTSSTNGGLIVSGGVGIAKNLNVGGDLNITGSLIGGQKSQATSLTGNLAIDFTSSTTPFNEYFYFLTHGNASDKVVSVRINASGLHQSFSFTLCCVGQASNTTVITLTTHNSDSLDAPSASNKVVLLNNTLDDEAVITPLDNTDYKVLKFKYMATAGNGGYVILERAD